MFVALSTKPEVVNGKLRFVVLANNFNLKENYGTIELKRKNDIRKMKLPIHLKLVNRMIIVPSRVEINKNEDGSFQDIFLTIISRQPDTSLDEIELLNPPTGYRIKEQHRMGKGKKQIRVEVPKHSINVKNIDLDFYCRNLNSRVTCQLSQ